VAEKEDGRRWPRRRGEEEEEEEEEKEVMSMRMRSGM
jgi:hypothetical protein